MLVAIDDFLETLRLEADQEALDAPDDEEEAADGEPSTVMEFVDCPHCGERIGIALDLSGDDQDAIQDCDVCCSPIHITYSVNRGRMTNFSAQAS